MDFSLIIDWLGREGGEILSWWLLVTLAGMAACRCCTVYSAACRTGAIP